MAAYVRLKDPEETMVEAIALALMRAQAQAAGDAARPLNESV